MRGLFLLLCAGKMFGQTLLQQNLDVRTYDFARTSPAGASGAISAGGTSVITLKPCPYGLSTSHAVRIRDASSSEVVIPSVVACPGGAPSGTITILTSNSYTGWSVGSATAGIQEASNSYDTFSLGGVVLFVPGGTRTIYAPIKLKSTVTVQGVGNTAEGTRLKAGSANLKIFDDVYRDPGSSYDDITIRDLTLVAFDESGPNTNVGINMQGVEGNQKNTIMVSNVSCTNLRYCLYIDGVNNLKARGITTFAYSPIFIGGSGTHPAGTMSQNISIDGMIVAGPSDWSGSGTDPIIRINKVGTVNINDMRTIANLPATRSGIVVDITGGGVAEDVNIRNALIIGGNIAYKYVGASFSSLTDSTADLQSVGAVFLSGATQIKVSDNVITDSAVYNGTTPCNYQYGITATSGSHEIMISNNIVTGGYYGLQCGDAITMDGTTGEVSVISNDIWAASRAGQARGIVITDGSQGPVVVGNNFRDSVISPVTGITTATPAVVSCDNVAGGIFDLKYRIGSIVTFDGGTGDWSRLSGTKWTVTAATTTNFTINSLGATGFTGSPPTRVFHAGVGIQDFTSGEILGDPHGRTIYANRIPQSATLPLAHGMINGFSGQFPGGYTAAWGHYEVAKVAVGYGSAASSCTAPGGCWKVTDPRGAITYSNIVGSDQQVVVASLPAGTFVEAARIQTTTAFANVTTAQAQLGLNTDFDFFISAPYDLKAAVSATNFSPQDGKLVNYGGTHNLPIGTNLVLRIAATGGNLDVLNNGASVAVWVKWAVLR